MDKSLYASFIIGNGISTINNIIIIIILVQILNLLLGITTNPIYWSVKQNPVEQSLSLLQDEGVTALFIIIDYIYNCLVVISLFNPLSLLYFHEWVFSFHLYKLYV